MDSRTERIKKEAANAANLGDDYKFTRDPEVAESRRHRRRERAERQSKVWQEIGTKWTRCLAPGCKFQTPKELMDGIELPICSVHAVAVWESVNALIDQPWATESIQALRTRRDLIALQQQVLREQDEAESQEWLKSPDCPGEIYYARVGGLIKVGWTSNLHSRIRSYGPDAELLVHYDGTRRDETNLHRQLAPSRAKGREWYNDDPIVRAFVSNAIRQHGEPRVTNFGWTEAKPVVAGKRVNRSA